MDEEITIADLTPDGRNARHHTPRNVGMIVNALQEVGAARSIVIDEEGTILAGNATVEAAAEAGIERVQVVDADGETIVAVRRRGLTPEQKARLALLDNRTAELAGWDAAQLLALAEEGVPLGDLWRDDEWAELLAQARAGDAEPPEDAGPQLDKAEELREKWQTASGQLWSIPSKSVPGKAHRLLCGDSTKAEDVERLMGGERAGAIVGDPPYGMRLDADFSSMVNHLDFARDKGVQRGRKYEPVVGDEQDFNAAPVIAILGDPLDQFWFGADYYASSLPNTEHVGAWLVWDKRLDEIADRMFGSCFELIWSRSKCRREILRFKWAGIFGTEHEPQRGRFHPNQKPVPLIEALIQRTGGLVVDPFAGSGTTLVCGERLGRMVYAAEIAPPYIAVTLERLAQMGLEPRLANTPQ